MYSVDNLKPGDILLYSSKSLLGWLIRTKTFSRFSHVEIYIGDGLTITARPAGVNTYDYTSKDLVVVLRPIATEVYLGHSIAWFQSVRNQRYDWWGLFRFFRLGKESLDKQFCSEVCTRFSRLMLIKPHNDVNVWLRFQPFAEKYDADLVSPGMFYSSPNYSLVWDEKENGEM